MRCMPIPRKLDTRSTPTWTASLGPWRSHIRPAGPSDLCSRTWLWLGYLFDRIQFIRKLLSQTALAGGERYARHEINNQVVRKQVLLVTTNPQLDALFEQYAL